MRNFLPKLVLILLMGFSLPVLAQTVSGKVTSNGEPIPGVSVTVKGTNNGTVTDPEGKYSLSVPNSKTTLVVSFIGFATQTIEANGRSIIETANN